MDKSWNFIIREARKDEQKQLIDVFDKYGLLKKDKTFAEVKNVMQRTYGNQTYDAFLQSVMNSSHIEEPKDKANLDTYVISQIILPVLMQHEEMRIEFCKQEHFASSERKDFVREFNSRFRTSVVFKAKLPFYGLSLAGVKNEESSFFRNSMITSGAMTATMLGGPIGLGLWSAYKLFSKYGETKKEQEKSNENDKVSFTDKLTPVYLVLIHLHILHSQVIDSLDKAKSFVEETIKYADSTILVQDNKSLKGYHEWNEARLNFLLYFVTSNISDENSKIMNIARELKSQCNHRMREFIDKSYLLQLLPYSEGLIDFLYGLKPSHIVSSVYNSHKGLTLCEDGKKWLVDFQFPDTPVDESTYFLVDPVQKQQYALTCLYLELKGVDSDIHCVYFDEIYQKRFDMLKDSGISPIEPSIEEKYKNLDLRCRCIRHGIRPSFPPILCVIEEIEQQEKLSKDGIEKLQGIKDECQRISRYLGCLLEDYSKPESLEVDKEIKKAFDYLTKEGVNVVYDIPQGSTIHFGRDEFHLFVLDNIVRNIYVHAFKNNTIPNPQVYIKVINEDYSVKIKICNNGIPLKKDVDNFFEFKDDAEIPENRMGTYCIKKGMEYYDGNVSIATDADNYNGIQYSVTYVLTFKTDKI